MKTRFPQPAWLLAIAMLAAPVLAQIPTGTLTGKITNDGQPLPGATVTAKAPQLQGARTATTGANGDFALPNLPPGEYTVSIEMSGFAKATRTVKLGAAQVERVDVPLSVQSVTADIVVSGEKEVLSETNTAATTYSDAFLEKLPTARNIASAVNLSPGVNGNGPNGAFTVAGAMSFENLFLVNGVVNQDNVRNTPFNLFIEDAIQETTTAVSGLSAEFGRFTGGVVNTITKSGGNSFSGSFRVGFTNDDWSALAPDVTIRNANYVAGTPQKQTRINDTIPAYEATLGGPILKDRVWFFGAGRLQDQTTAARTSTTLVEYNFGDDEKRWEGKLTITPFSNHTLTGSYMNIQREQTNYGFPSVPFMDLASLYDRQLPQELIAVNYNGVLTTNLSVEAQYSNRKFSFENSGGQSTDLIQGTVGRDQSRGSAYFSPIFCGVCGPEKRNNDDYLLRGTYFLSTSSLGSHQIAAGYENFGGQRFSNNYQSGSNYHIFTTSTIVQGSQIYPQAVPGSNTLLVWYPIPVLTRGSDVRTWSVYLNDSWRLGNRLSFNVGVRYDKNDVTDSFGAKTANDSNYSPRLGVTWDVSGTGKLQVRASYGRYVAAPAETQASGGSSAGSPATYVWRYDGAPINPAGSTNLLTTAQVWQQIFTYFGITGTNQPANATPIQTSLPGVNLKIVGSLKSPNANEYTIGLGGQLARSGSFRVDAVYREYRDFYNERVDMSTGTVSNANGNRFDFRVIENTNIAKRKYVGLNTQFSYRVGTRFNLGGNWTWSHAYGNFDGETAGSGPVRFGVQIYPEYRDQRWNTPTGDLSIDQRHRLRLYANYGLGFVPQVLGTFDVGLLYQFDSGTPYGAIGTVNTVPYVTNPGYITPPSGGVNYAFTARDAFKTDDIQRVDLSLNWARSIGPVEIFIQPQVLNLFNADGVTAVNTTVNSAAAAGGGNNGFAAFNPFTTAPTQRPNGDTSVKTANWDYGPNFGQPTAFGSFQLPRTFRVSVGARF